MSRTPFKMPQRTPSANAEVDRWVAGEEGEKASEPRVSSSGRSSAKPARLTIDLPPELHKKFKAACALRGTRMIDEVRGFIESWIQKNG